VKSVNWPRRFLFRPLDNARKPKIPTHKIENKNILGPGITPA
jgi:hypothetical protein